MLAQGKIRSQMYFGVTMLVVIVMVLSAASFHGSLKFRTLTKSIRDRAIELPLAANLSQKVSDLRSAIWQHKSYELGVYQPTLSDYSIAPISFRNKLQDTKEALKDYKTRLENVDAKNSFLRDNQKEREFAANFERSLRKIDQIVNDGEWVLTPSNRGINELKEELEKLQSGTSQLPGLMNNRMNAFASKARHDYNSWMAVTALTSVAALAMIFLLYQRFNRRIFRPLDTLVEGSRIVARGDFDYRIKLETNDEVAELGEALNAMTSNFQEIKSDLNRQVKQRTKEVVRSEKMASVGFLAAGVAHEINNPLATIAWSAESLESRIEDILNPQSGSAGDRQTEIDDMKKYLQRIQEEAFRCKGITSGLLDFSRMGDVKKVPTNLYEIIESVIEMVSPLSKYRDRNIFFDGDPSILATVNAQEIKQVTLNLMTNALSCVDPGGIVRINLGKHNGNAVLSVTDNGCGMTPEVMKHLFEPFFTRRRDEQGTGLGLSITYQIIEDHGGRIVPHSDGPGKGSSFTVSLPLVENEQLKTQEQPKTKSLKVLFADDETHLQELIAAELPRMGHTVTVCPDGLTAIAALEKNTYDCVIVDLDMPGLNGIGVIEKTKAVSPTTEAVVLTGKGSTETAVSALRLGAFDYLQKPCKLFELRSLLEKVAVRRELNNQIWALRRRLQSVEGRPTMIGNHRSMQRVKALIEKVAPTNSTVLILGETGTGKELAARAVHETSHRAEKPFVALNCGALPENLIESELFGHRKGAFTGADDHRQGLFEVANGGTLFLDEIGELPKPTQSKLLRVLESGEIRRVGDNDAFQVDVRIVCATHRNLAKMVAADEFRQDLMYRINTFEIQLPPLRDRMEDIVELATHLLKRHRAETRLLPAAFDPVAIKRLQSYDWPGNIRELANVVERASILCDRLPITSKDLPSQFGSSAGSSNIAAQSGPSLRDIEMQAIHSALDQNNGNKTAAANQLGISLKTLYNKLNQAALKKAA